MNHTPSPLGLILGTPGTGKATRIKCQVVSLPPQQVLVLDRVADGFAGVGGALGGQVIGLGPGGRTLTLPAPVATGTAAGAAGGSR